MGLFETLGNAMNPNTGKSLDEVIVENGKRLSKNMYNDPEYRQGVGGENSGYFTHEGKEYHIKVSAFWEKHRHFDYNVVGIRHEFKKSKCCNDF